jgi:hypothetical protein
MYRNRPLSSIVKAISWQGKSWRTDAPKYQLMLG